MTAKNSGITTPKSPKLIKKEASPPQYVYAENGAESNSFTTVITLDNLTRGGTIAKNMRQNTIKM